MSKEPPGPADLAAGFPAPFGRPGAALGFRWIMPFGTLPLPFHPALARLLPALVAAIALHRLGLVAVGRSGGYGWPGLLLAAGLLGVPMSVPILNWLAMAFRLPLLQGLLAGGAALLIGAEALRGMLPLAALSVPIGFFALYLVQRVGGPIALRRLQADNASFEPVVAGQRPIVLEGRAATRALARAVLADRGAAAIAVEPDQRARRAEAPAKLWRLRPADAARVARRMKQVRPSGWRLHQDVLETPDSAAPDDHPPIRVRVMPHRSLLWLLGGSRTLLEVDDGRRVRRLVGGEASLVSALPLFVCFYWTSLFGGRSQWFFGFVRKPPVALGGASLAELLSRALPPRDVENSPCVDAAILLAALDAAEEAEIAEARSQLAALLDRAARIPQSWAALARHKHLLAGQGEALCAALAAAKAADEARAVRMAADLISMLPEAEFRGLSGTLLRLLDSKALAFRLVDSELALGLPERERRHHVIGGFSLIRYVPDLYERLAELGEPARRLIMALGEAGGWPRPVLRARERLDELRR